MSKTEDIFVRLPEESVEVWRPVKAEHVRENVFRIVDQPYDSDIEAWQFIPGDEVICEMVDVSDGRIFAATRKAQR